MNLLEVSHLRKTFGHFVAVEDVSFSVGGRRNLRPARAQRGRQSTTMNMIVGAASPNSGRSASTGRMLEPENRELRMALGVVPQDLAIYPDLTARREPALFRQALRNPRTRTQVRGSSEALWRTGLDLPCERPRRQLFRRHETATQFRRRASASAAAVDPRRPTVGVDPQSRAHLLDCVRSLSAEGIAAVYASHYMEEVEALCQRVAIVDRGRVLACDHLRTL